MTVGYGAKDIGSKVEEIEFQRRKVGPTDVGIEILYSGICHSDLHTINNDWKNSLYPSVPGHEIVGQVTSIGAKVTNFKVGEMVAVGTFVDSCRKCHACVSGDEIYCSTGKLVMTYNTELEDGSGHTYGGYAHDIVTDEKYVYSLPKGLDAARTAPILCAGITVYQPLVEWGAGPGKKVAIAGIGGLGHMAVKLAAAMGAEVTVITRSEGKASEAKRLGADYVLVGDDKKPNYFDLIVDTIPYEHSLDKFIEMLALDGTIANVGNITKVEFSGGPLMFKRGVIAGSAAGGTRQTRDLLKFCAKMDVYPDCEIVKPSELNTVLKRLHKGDVKYRFVMDMKK